MKVAVLESLESLFALLVIMLPTDSEIIFRELSPLVTSDLRGTWDLNCTACHEIVMKLISSVGTMMFLADFGEPA